MKNWLLLALILGCLWPEVAQWENYECIGEVCFWQPFDWDAAVEWLPWVEK